MREIINKFGDNLPHDQRIINILEQILEKEKTEQEKGNYTFVHAQEWKWHVIADIFKMLWQLVYQEHVDDYKFLRFMQKPMELAQDCALDTKKGPRMFAFNTADKASIQEYTTLRDRIFAELEKQLYIKTSGLAHAKPL